MIALLFVYTGSAFILALTIRNHFLFKYRTQLLFDILSVSQREIHAGNYDYNWRYDWAHEVPYGFMLWRFWRSFDSFYPDREEVMKFRYTR